MSRLFGVLAVSAAAAACAACAAAFSEKPIVRSHLISSSKIKGSVKILQISDLHASCFGKDQSGLISLIDGESPDLIVLTGDIADNRKSNNDTFLLAGYIGKKYPCFYVDGNHEVYTGIPSRLKRRFAENGFTVLEGNTVTLAVKGNTVSLSGIGDPYDRTDPSGRSFEKQLLDCDSGKDDTMLTVLLSHRPELTESYEKTSFDLIFTGHAHGGQVVIPGIINGLYAPHQGIFPKYAGGKYRLENGSTLFVSRGLSTFVRPRVFNRPELVSVTVKGTDVGLQESL